MAQEYLFHEYENVFKPFYKIDKSRISQNQVLDLVYQFHQILLDLMVEILNWDKSEIRWIKRLKFLCRFRFFFFFFFLIFFLIFF